MYNPLVQRLYQHLVVIGFLALTTAGFILTMFRVYVPFLPRFFVTWSYGMMAPYQGDNDWNGGIEAEAQLPDGSWKPVSLDRYLPFGPGERNVREFLRLYKEDDQRRAGYTLFARQLLQHERERGESYVALRIWWEEWPRSPGGFQFLRHEPFFIEKTLVAEVMASSL